MRRGRNARPIAKRRGGRRYRRAVTLPGPISRRDRLRAGLAALAAALHGLGLYALATLKSPRIPAALVSMRGALASAKRAVLASMTRAALASRRAAIVSKHTAIVSKHAALASLRGALASLRGALAWTTRVALVSVSAVFVSMRAALRFVAFLPGRIAAGAGRLYSALYGGLTLALCTLWNLLVRAALAAWRMLVRVVRWPAADRLPNLPGGDPVMFGLAAGAALILVAGLVVLAGGQLRPGEPESMAIAQLPDLEVVPSPETPAPESEPEIALVTPYMGYDGIEAAPADIGPPAALVDPELPDAGENLAAATPLLDMPGKPVGEIVAVLPDLPRDLPLAAPEPPQWLANAVQPAVKHKGPMIAIVIDDAGVAQARTRRAIDLPPPLTIAFIPYSQNLTAQTRQARRNGHELLVHIPMEPSTTDDPGKNALLTTLAPDEIMRRFRWALARFDGYVGVNNHMGSKFMARADLVKPLLAEMNARGLLFLDSRTMASTVGAGLARDMEMPHASRNVFIDNELDAASIASQLAEVERVARRKGHAIAIGHPHNVTIDVLAEWIPQARARGFTLVPVSAIVRLDYGGEIDLAAASGGGKTNGLLGRPQ